MVTVILITAILLAVMLVGIALWVRCKDYTVPNITGGWLISLGGVGLCIWLFTILLVYLGSFSTARELEAFYHDTQSAYEYTISATEDVVIDPSETRGDAITDFSYQEQGQAVSERIREFRNKIAWYNEALRKLQGRNEWPILGAIYEDAPDDLRPIVLGAP